MAHRRLAVDIDGCLADFTTAYAEILISVAGDKLPDGWRTDPGFPTEWYWDRAAGYAKKEENEAWGRILASPDFWQRLEAMPGTDETLAVLDKLAKKGHEVYFLTHRMGDNPKLQTENWLAFHGMDYPTVIISGNKIPVLNAMKADFFIDDKPDTLQDAARNAWEGLQGHLWAVNTPYNRENRPGTVRGAESVKEALQEEGLWAE